ncbi:MAG: hypothetical protein HOQ02_11770 [Lysobacter sp.]|nr:hypothetical protein [Lysobacter sp.]
MIRKDAMWMGLALATLLPAAWAATEPVAEICVDTGTLCVWQQPTVAAPAGWERKAVASSHYRASAFAPVGRNFANAPAVMYAKAVPKNAGASTLAAFMADDLASYRAQDGKLDVQNGLKFADGDGRELPAVRLMPGAGGTAQWQTVAYAEEAGYFVVFSLSAHGKVDQDAALPAFQQLVRSYHAERATRAKG